jgi:hypothetical protein
VKFSHCPHAAGFSDKLPAGEHMATRVRRLLGNGKLSDSDGRDFNADVRYELTVTSKDIPAPHLGDPTAVVRGSTNDTINGHISILSGLYRQAGEMLTLTLEDGKKLKVIMGFSGEVTGSGGFY